MVIARNPIEINTGSLDKVEVETGSKRRSVSYTLSLVLVLTVSMHYSRDSRSSSVEIVSIGATGNSDPFLGISSSSADRYVYPLILVKTTNDVASGDGESPVSVISVTFVR